MESLPSSHLEASLYTAPRGMVQWARLAVALAAAVGVAGLVLDPTRTWLNVLLVGYALAGLGLAGMVFVAMHYASGAGWATALRRVPEAFYPLVVTGSILVLAAIFLGGPHLYPWLAGHGAATGEHAFRGFKALWLRPGFFQSRALVYAAVWVAFASRLLHLSRAQDANRTLALHRRATRTSIGFLFAFGVTLSGAGVDWLMALEPHWFSTIFGVYQFAGLFLAGLAAITLVVLVLSDDGPLAGVVGEAHLHDLGKLLFAFSIFWMYIWFSQFMLIWYSNLPEETAYFVPRTFGGWRALFVANVIVNWVVPFLVLLSQPAKRSRKVLARIAVLLLVGRWLDLYLMIAPPLLGSEPAIGGWEAAFALGGIGVFVLVVTRAFGAAPPVPLGDPLLAESLHHH